MGESLHCNFALRIFGGEYSHHNFSLLSYLCGLIIVFTTSQPRIFVDESWHPTFVPCPSCKNNRILNCTLVPLLAKNCGRTLVYEDLPKIICQRRHEGVVENAIILVGRTKGKGRMRRFVHEDARLRSCKDDY